MTISNLKGHLSLTREEQSAFPFIVGVRFTHLTVPFHRVMEYAKGLGWSEELLKFDGAIEAIKDCPFINRVCGKKITPQGKQSAAIIGQSRNVFLPT